MTQTTMLDAALALAGRGLAILPLHSTTAAGACTCGDPDCESIAKHPRLSGWQEKATTAADQIRRWWTRWPAANIGLAAGRSGIVFVDLDVKHGADGPGKWADLCAELGLNGSETNTVTVTTPTGGKHLYFRAPEGIKLSNTAGKLGPGIDTRAGNGLVVAPPSRTHKGAYTWGPTAELLPLPTAIADLLAKPEPRSPAPSTPSGRDLSPYVKAALDNEVLTVTRAREDTRNDTLNKAAYALGGLVGAAWAELDQATAEDELSRAARACGLPEGEATKTIASGLQSGIANPRPEPADRAPAASRAPTGARPAANGAKSAENDAQEAQETPTEPKMPDRLGARLSANVAEYIRRIAPEIPDHRLSGAITAALLETREAEDGKRKAIPVLLKRRKARDILLAWLLERGGFVQSESGQLFYFYTQGRRLFALDSALWAGFLYAASGVNPASTDYAHLAADCKTTALGAPKHKIVKVAAWDDADQVLRVSRFDGTVYRLDGATIREEANGEGVIFDDPASWDPYTPDFDGGGAALRWSTTDLPNYDTGGPEQDNEKPDVKEARRQTRLTWGLAYRAWVLATFFSELCPTRPLCVFLGEKGSGKSMALRVLVRLLFGLSTQISGAPDKPDSFTAATSASHVYVIDNLDKFTSWLRDKLARIATGANDILRELYTTNETRLIAYRCWVGITSRTPDTLQRDDLADRLLVLPVLRIEDAQRQAENAVYKQVAELRDRWWGDVLQALNQAVASIRAGELHGASKLRLADWELLGRVFAKNEDNTELWTDVIANILTGQSELLLEGDPFVEALTLWLGNEANHGRALPVRELHRELELALYGDKKPGLEWFKTSRGLGRYIKAVRHDLNTLFDLDTDTPTSGDYHKITVWQFWPKGTRPQQEGF